MIECVLKTNEFVLKLSNGDDEMSNHYRDKYNEERYCKQYVTSSERNKAHLRIKYQNCNPYI